MGRQDNSDLDACHRTDETSPRMHLCRRLELCAAQLRRHGRIFPIDAEEKGEDHYLGSLALIIVNTWYAF